LANNTIVVPLLLPTMLLHGNGGNDWLQRSDLMASCLYSC